MFISALVFQLNLHFLWMKQQIMFQHNLKRSKLYCWWKRRKKKTEEERFKFLASSWIKSHESCSDIPHRTTEKHCCLPFIHKMRWKKKNFLRNFIHKRFFLFFQTSRRRKRRNKFNFTARSSDIRREYSWRKCSRWATAKPKIKNSTSNGCATSN